MPQAHAAPARPRRAGLGEQAGDDRIPFSKDLAAAV
jgi:hypothetical protein